MVVRCELIDTCPIVKYFSDQAWQLMLERYCYGEFSTCHRYQLRQKGLPTVPQHILPWDNDSHGSNR